MPGVSLSGIALPAGSARVLALTQRLPQSSFLCALLFGAAGSMILASITLAELWLMDLQ